MQSPVRNIIFDWCGTLVDDLPAVWRATNKVFAQAGVPPLSLDRFREEFELPFERFYDRFTPHVTMTQLESWYMPAFHEEQHSVHPLPQAKEFLAFCHKNRLRLFLLSSIHPDHFSVHLQRTGFQTFFEMTYVGVRDKRTQIHDLIESHRLNRDETLFVGDMRHDIETARHGGIRSCAVLTGFNHLQQLKAAKPDIIVEHLGELKRILEAQGVGLSKEAPFPKILNYPVITVGGAIFNDQDEVLLVRTQKWSCRWGIPGGKTQYGERSEEALVRELREETNLEVHSIEFVLFQDCIDSPEFYRPAHFVLLNYLCRASGNQTVRLNDEADSYQWVPLEAALAMNINAPTRILLEAIQRRRKGLPVDTSAVVPVGPENA